MASRDTISDNDYCNLLDQLDNMLTDNDRVRLVTAAAESHWYKCEDVRGLVDQQHYGRSKTSTAILLYPRIVDKEHFKDVLDGFQVHLYRDLGQKSFEEDKKEIVTALGLNADGSTKSSKPSAPTPVASAPVAAGGGGNKFCSMCGADCQGQKFCAMCGAQVN